MHHLLAFFCLYSMDAVTGCCCIRGCYVFQMFLTKQCRQPAICEGILPRNHILRDIFQQHFSVHVLSCQIWFVSITEGKQQQIILGKARCRHVSSQCEDVLWQGPGHRRAGVATTRSSLLSCALAHQTLSTFAGQAVAKELTTLHNNIIITMGLAIKFVFFSEQKMLLFHFLPESATQSVHFDLQSCFLFSRCYTSSYPRAFF